VLNARELPGSTLAPLWSQPETKDQGDDKPRKGRVFDAHRCFPIGRITALLQRSNRQRVKQRNARAALAGVRNLSGANYRVSRT